MQLRLLLTISLGLTLSSCANDGVSSGEESSSISSSSEKSLSANSSSSLEDHFSEGNSSSSIELLSSSQRQSSENPSSSSHPLSSSSAFVAPWSAGQDWCATAGNCGTFEDPRTVSTYRWTKIQGRKWMADDLNYPMSSGSLELSQTAQVYSFPAAMNACPVGWHLPGYEEWEMLREFVGGVKHAGKALKKSTGWDTWGTDSTYAGADAYGFHATPAPEYEFEHFSFVDQEDGFWWTGTPYRVETGEISGFGVYMNAGNDEFQWTTGRDDDMMRIRCVEDPATIERPLSSWCDKAGHCGSFTDSRDGQQYRWTKIGTQQWMAENLNYSGDDGAGSKSEKIGWCYGNKLSLDTTKHTDDLQCDLYGRLYNNVDAVSVCPSGWRIPTASDFDSLLINTASDHHGLMYPLGDFREYTKDVWGFSALPAGKYDDAGRMEYFARAAQFWYGSSQDQVSEFFYLDNTFEEDGYGFMAGIVEGDAHSIRCIKK